METEKEAKSRERPRPRAALAALDLLECLVGRILRMLARETTLYESVLELPSTCCRPLLNALLPGVAIAQRSVLPNIAPTLLPKKTGGSAMAQDKGEKASTGGGERKKGRMAG
ncbi:hypothetical protein RvY_02341 [Ramazzottius varieornatus]|uniref:Histone H2A C-terminal domain-containing protein n=1 Tax=Ramazzottius varieornatus TaxID=947166 RepID=A0A1D1UJE2_RAMVA|nr:hypothetical protein RvY_02341 [Ramazzottius varieornatus]